MGALRRRAAILAVLLALLLLAALFYAVHGLVTNRADVDRMHRLVNDRRIALHVGRLRIGPGLRDYADRHAERLARARRIFHDPCHGCSEIVGATPGGVFSIFEAWLRSPAHRAIVLSRSLGVIGCGKARAAGIDYWVCELRPT